MQYLSSIRSLILHCFIASVFLYSCGSSPSSSEGEEATSQIEVANEPEEEQPTVVFVTGDHEYSSEGTMPKLAAELEQNYGLKTVVLKSSPDYNAEENIPGLEALQDADMAVFFLRWRRLPADQVKHIEDYLKTGKPVIGFRTSTHAFNYPEGHELENWNAFGEFALNAPPGWGGDHNHTHYGHESTTEVSAIEDVADHPILTGVDQKFDAASWLYTTLPDYPTENSEWLLMGSAVNPNKEAIDHPVAWTGTNSFGSKIFTTTLGHPYDFDREPFQRLVINAVHWVLDIPVPQEWAGPVEMNVAYHGIEN